jgi:hypothetical protein
LFLRRANLAEDLTANLRGQVVDPGEVLLRAGGVGGDSLKGKAMKSGIELTQPEAAPSAIPKDAAADAKPLPAKDDAPEPVAGELGARLVKAAPAQRDALLAQMRDAKGADFTEALAEAIPRLNGPARVQAQDALAMRLSRMNADTLRDKLRDDNREVRRAAALACVMREEKSRVPDLITLLKDADASVARAAHVALRELTGQDFGPAADAGPTARDQAIGQWKAWWAKQNSP